MRVGCTIGQILKLNLLGKLFIQLRFVIVLGSLPELFTICSSIKVKYVLGEGSFYQIYRVGFDS